MGNVASAKRKPFKSVLDADHLAMSKALDAAMTKADLSIYEAAAKLGDVWAMTVWRWRTGHSPIKRVMYEALISICNERARR